MKRVKRLIKFGILCIVALLLSGVWTVPFISAGEGAGTSKVSSALSLRIAWKKSLKAQGGGALQAKADSVEADAESPTLPETEKIFLYFNEKPTDRRINELEALGVTVYPDSWIPPTGNHPRGFLLAEMPIDKLDALAAQEYLICLGTAEQALEPQNDLGRAAMNVESVWSAGYDGSGIMVAVLDSGLDTANADIPTPAEAKDYSNYPTLDNTITNTATGHGTHVTGSLLGRGAKSGGRYAGAAKGAGLVFLKIGNNTNGNASTAAMVGAIKAAVDVYHARIISISYGGWGDAHDGTGAEAQAVDYAVGKGAAVFIAAGNYGSSGWHYSGTVGANSAVDIPITVLAGSSSLSTGLIWYDGPGTHNFLSLEYYNGSLTTRLSSSSGGQSESPRGTDWVESNLNSNVSAGTYYLRVKNASASGQFFHLYYYGGSRYVAFSDPDPFYTLASPADADGAIAVGAYITRKYWTNYQGGGDRYFASDETVGQIATFSSRGPRVDGLIPGKPNIAAPGSAIVSARDPLYQLGNVNYTPYIIDNDGTNNGAGPADYFVMQGTSMACPLAAGVGALALDRTPTLTPAQLRHALEVSATDRGDAGQDDIYGWGLINAASAIEVRTVLHSYLDSAHTNASDLFNSGTVYLYGTGYLKNHNYRIAYYDGSNRRVATLDAVSGDAGSLSCEITLSPATHADGTWHAVVFEPEFDSSMESVYGTYDPSCPYAIAMDTFVTNLIPDLTITTDSPLPAGDDKTAYSAIQIEASAGAPPYKWSKGGKWPSGFNITDAGIISGKPSRMGSYVLIVKVADSIGAVATKTFAVTINPAVTMRTPKPDVGYTGTGYSYLPSAGRGTGAGTYTWMITTGSLPGGLALNSLTGEISGIPVTAGSFKFTLAVTDTLGGSAHTSLTIRIK